MLFFFFDTRVSGSILMGPINLLRSECDDAPIQFKHVKCAEEHTLEVLISRNAFRSRKTFKFYICLLPLPHNNYGSHRRHMPAGTQKLSGERRN